MSAIDHSWLDSLLCELENEREVKPGILTRGARAELAALRAALARARESAERASARVHYQAQELTKQHEQGRKKNLALDALHYVWCDGGCELGAHRFGEHPPMTEEMMNAARRNMERLEKWWRSESHRIRSLPPAETKMEKQ